MTVDSIAQQLAFEFGEQYADLDVKTQFIAWVQEAHTDIYQAAPWPFRNETLTVNLAGGVFEAEVSDAYIVRAMYIYSSVGDSAAVGQPIVYVPVERLIGRPNTNLVDDAGRPVAWYFVDHEPTTHLTKLGFYPKPVSSYVIKVPVLKVAPALAATDEIALPEDLIPALRAGVRARVLDNDKDAAGSQKAEAAMNAAVQGVAATHTGPQGARSTLRVKQAKAVHQAPVAQGAGA